MPELVFTPQADADLRELGKQSGSEKETSNGPEKGMITIVAITRHP